MNQIDTGKFIASCRKEKGLTQAQLAEKLNITDRAVSKWETGKCMPDSSIMSVSYTHLRAHETDSYLVCRLLLEKKKNILTRPRQRRIH